jgi:hypothetical protein
MALGNQVTLWLFFPLALAVLGFYGDRGRKQVEEVDKASETMV